MNNLFLHAAYIATFSFFAIAQNDVFTDFSQALEKIEISKHDDYNFDAKTISMNGYDPLGAAFSLKSNRTLQELFDDFQKAYSSPKLGKWHILFPLHTCECDPFFNRTSAGAASIRTSYEQTICCMLEKAYKTNPKKPICFISIGSGFLLTDFLIIDQFLTNHPNAHVIVRFIDIIYTHYILLVRFYAQNKDIIITDTNISDIIKMNKPSSASIKKRAKDIALTVHNAQQKYSSQEIEKIINILRIHECFQTFIRLINKRHPKSTVDIYIDDEIEAFSTSMQLKNLYYNNDYELMPEFIPDVIGSIDSPFEDFYEKENISDIALKTKIKLLYQACSECKIYPNNFFVMRKCRSLTKQDDATTLEKTLVLATFFPSEKDRPTTLANWTQENLLYGIISLTKTFPSNIIKTEKTTDQYGKIIEHNVFTMKPEDFQQAQNAINTLCKK